MISRPEPPVLVLDAGALIALEQAKPTMTSLLLRVKRGDVRLIVPDAVVAQVWRGGAGRQARVAAMLGLKAEQCRKVALDTVAAKRIGVKIGESGHADVVDVQVALITSDHGAAVITSDRDDLLAVDPDLKDFVISV